MPHFYQSGTFEEQPYPTNEGRRQRPLPTSLDLSLTADQLHPHGASGLSTRAEIEEAAMGAHVLVRTLGLSREGTAAVRRTIPAGERQTSVELTNLERAAFILAWQDEIENGRERMPRDGLESSIYIAQQLGMQFPDYPSRSTIQPKTVYLAEPHEEDVRDDVLLLLQALDSSESVSPQSQYKISERISTLVGTETPVLASYRHLIRRAAPVFDPSVVTSWGDAGVPTPLELFEVYHRLRVLTSGMVYIDAVSSLIPPIVQLLSR